MVFYDFYVRFLSLRKFCITIGVADGLAVYIKSISGIEIKKRNHAASLCVGNPVLSVWQRALIKRSSRGANL